MPEGYQSRNCTGLRASDVKFYQFIASKIVWKCIKAVERPFVFCLLLRDVFISCCPFPVDLSPGGPGVSRLLSDHGPCQYLLFEEKKGFLHSSCSEVSCRSINLCASGSALKTHQTLGQSGRGKLSFKLPTDQRSGQHPGLQEGRAGEPFCQDD